ERLVPGLRMTTYSLLQSIIRRFAGDDYIVNMAFPQSCPADPDKTSFLLQFGNTPSSTVTHPRAQSADQLVHHGGQRSSIGYAPLDSFGDEFTQAVAIPLTLFKSGGRI